MPDLTDAELYNIALATYCSLENEQTEPTDFMLDDEIIDKYYEICESKPNFEENMKKSVKKLAADFSYIEKMQVSDYESSEEYFNDKSRKEKEILSKLTEDLIMN